MSFAIGLVIGYIARHYIHPHTLQDWTQRSWAWIKAWFGR